MCFRSKPKFAVFRIAFLLTKRIDAMKYLTMKTTIGIGVLMLLLAHPALSEEPRPAKITSIDGVVRDLSCPIQNPEAKAKDFDLECAIKCARAGSPLIIQTQDDQFYIPISGNTPDKGQRERLMPFVGKYVRVTGQVFERSGTRAIAIQDIKVLPSNK